MANDEYLTPTKIEDTHVYDVIITSEEENNTHPDRSTNGTRCKCRSNKKILVAISIALLLIGVTWFTAYIVTRDKYEHKNTDECMTFNSFCNNGHCVNINGSFTCICQTGYNLYANDNSCTDIDECTTLDNACQNGQCVNTEGSFTCKCQTGYTLSSYGKICLDIDECTTLKNVCQNGQCVNTDGSFTCKCQKGYILSSNGKFCSDIDECAALGDVCSNGQCINTAGSFTCRCRAGYKLSSEGNTCTAVCPAGWIHFQNHCYLLNMATKTWLDAQTYCMERNSNLVKVNDAVQNAWIISIMQQRGINKMWIGANDRHIEDRFTWISDNSELVFTDWDVGEPNSYQNRSEDCVEIWNDFSFYKWNDIPCTMEKQCMCEKRST